MTSSPAPPDTPPAASDEAPRSLARDSVGTTIANGALFLLGIIIWIAVARFLGPTWRGALALVMLAPMIVMKVGPFGFDQGTVVLGAERKHLGPLTRTGVVLGFIMGLVFIGLLMWFMWGFPKTFWRISQVWLPELFMVISLAFPLHLMTLAYDAAIYAEDRIAARNVKELVVNLVMLAVILVAFYGWRLQLFGVIGAYLVANVVSLIYAWLLVRRRVNLAGGMRLELTRQALKLGFPVYLAQLATYLMLPAMMVLLSAALPGEPGENLARIAFFTMGYQMVDRILPVTRSVAFALLPKITAGSDEAARELAAKASRHTLLASIAIFAVLVALMHPIVAVLLGRRYLSVVGAFAIMAPGGVALSVAGVWAAHLLARKRPLKVAWAGMAGVAAALALAGSGFSLLPPGREVFIASSSVVVGSFVNAGLLLPAFCRVGGIQTREALLPSLDDLREWRRIPGFIGEYLGRMRLRPGKVNRIT